MAVVADLAVREHNIQRQLWLNFDTEPELKKQAEQYEQDPPPEAEGEIFQSFIEQLQKGEQCMFAGGLMHHLFLNEIEFEQIINNTDECGSTYQVLILSQQFFHSISQGIASIETLKLVNAYDFGLLIGRPRIPEQKNNAATSQGDGGTQ